MNGILLILVVAGVVLMCVSVVTGAALYIIGAALAIPAFTVLTIRWIDHPETRK